MKLSRQNKIVVGIVALVLALTVGYALFSQSLNIGGTASAKGEFKLIFADASESGNSPTCVGFSGTCEISSLSSIIEEGKTLTITVDKLNYPGAYVQIPAVIKNEGTVDAKLTGITTEGLSNDDMEVTYTGLEQNDIINPDVTRDIVITIKWKESSVITASSLSFNIGLNYEQIKVGDITTVSDTTTGASSGPSISEYPKSYKASSEYPDSYVVTLNSESEVNFLGMTSSYSIGDKVEINKDGYPTGNYYRVSATFNPSKGEEEWLLIHEDGNYIIGFMSTDYFNQFLAGTNDVGILFTAE